MRIFVADDSAAIQKVVRLAFTGYECEILVAESAVSLASMLKQTPPDVVLADPKLAGIDGPETLKKILGSTKVILLLGSYESIDESLWRDHGFEETIKKPFVGKILIEAVARLGSELKLVKAREQGASEEFSHEPTRTNQMAMATLDIDLDFFQKPEDSDVQLDVAIPQPLVQAKDRGKKAFDEDKGIATVDLGAHKVPELTLDPGQPADWNPVSKGELSSKHQAAPSPKAALDIGLDLGQHPTKPQAPAEKVSFSMGDDTSSLDEHRNLRGFSQTSSPHQPIDTSKRRESSQGPHGIQGESSPAVNLDPEKLLNPYWPRIQELIRVEIRQYLDLHFKAQIPGIAKEVIAAEIRRLSEEKARINIDN